MTLQSSAVSYVNHVNKLTMKKKPLIMHLKVLRLTCIFKNVEPVFLFVGVNQPPGSYHD